MTLFDKVRDNLAELLRPGTRQEAGELKALRELYDNSNAAQLRPNKWYQTVGSASGQLHGFSFVCNCNREFQLVHPNEWMRDYECPQCRAKFNLYRQAGIIDASGTFKVSALEIEKILAALPVRPRLSGARTPQFIDTWDDNETVAAGNVPPGADGGWV